MAEQKPPSVERTSERSPGESLRMSKKERRELKRKEKASEVDRQTRIRFLKKGMLWAVAVLVAGGIVTGIIFFFKTQTPQSMPGDFVPQMSREHIPVGAAHAPYTSNPPSSGPHYDTPQACGIYTQQLIDETVVHTLEHGAVWISYKPGMEQRIIDQLVNLGKEYPKIVVSPRSKNDSDIAIVAWTRILKMDAQHFDAGTFQDFIKSWGNKAPESVPC